MYSIEKFYDEPPFKSKALDFYLQNDGNKKMACLDIETTGLSPEKSAFILGALLEFKEDGYLLKQYFAETPDEEKDILVHYMKDIEKIDILFTYNGKNFDLKYLKSKLAKYDVFKDFEFPLNIDVYLFVNGFSKLRNFLPNLKQKTVENYMGLWDKRDDTISGAESVQRYYTYLSTKDENIRREILLHNSDDVLQLARILPVLLKIDLPRAFLNSACPLAFVTSENIKLTGKFLCISGYANTNFSYFAYNIDEQTCSLKIDKTSKTFSLELPTIKKADMQILSLKNIDADFSPLADYENFAEGYLLLKRGSTTYEKSLIHALQIVFARIQNLT